MRTIEVLPYSDEWPLAFEREADQLRAVFGGELLAMHHIGSTSVPGLSAKPIIDVMPVVREIAAVDSLTDKMKELGYEAKGENGLPGRRYFQKGGDARTHHVHVYAEGADDIERHLAFRDYLRMHPERAREYGEWKERLARRHPADMAAYIRGKDGLVREIEKEALTWRDMWNDSGKS